MKSLLIALILLIPAFTIHAQETEKKSKKELKAEKEAKEMEDVKAMVDSKTFVFKARTVNPMKGRTINLTTDYDVKITGDSIFSYLPYFGVAYTASYGGTDSPMIFDKPFESCKSEKTKNGYLINVTAKNESDRLEYSFHISETGSTSLLVSSTNRQSISYYGDLEKIKENKETK